MKRRGFLSGLGGLLGAVGIGAKREPQPEHPVVDATITQGEDTLVVIRYSRNADGKWEQTAKQA